MPKDRVSHLSTVQMGKKRAQCNSLKTTLRHVQCLVEISYLVYGEGSVAGQLKYETNAGS